MPRPGRLYPHPTITANALQLLNVVYITDIAVNGVNLVISRDRGGQPIESLIVTFPTTEEALAAAEVWRARVDDAP